MALQAPRPWKPKPSERNSGENAKFLVKRRVHQVLVMSALGESKPPKNEHSLYSKGKGLEQVRSMEVELAFLWDVKVYDYVLATFLLSVDADAGTP